MPVHDTPPRPQTIARIRALPTALVAPALALALASALPPDSALAAIIAVTTTDDEVSVDGDCSLREAIVAANTNTAFDACPAGANASTDVIALAGGATYALTLAAPALPADDPLGGDLDVADNAADPDVDIRSGLGARSIIRQTVSGQKVMTVAGSADLDAIVISGGSASDCGGGITFVGTGTSTVTGSEFTKNTALNGGGICNAAAGSTLLIGSSTFADNAVGTGRGGGIQNLNGTTTVVGSVFLRNQGAISGGAVNNDRNLADAVTIDGSCFLDNSDVAVANNDPPAQTATTSWWGHSSGPSGAGPGGGDSVDPTYDFSGFLTAPPEACFPMQLVRNPAFELTDGGSGPLASWKPSGLGAGDGQLCGDPFDCTLVLSGSGKMKRLEQVLRVDGSAGDVLVLTASSRAKDVPFAPGAYRVQATVTHVDGSQQVKRIAFAPGTHPFETASKTIVTSEPWKKVRVEILYAKPGGTVRFDDVGLTFGTPPS